MLGVVSHKLINYNPKIFYSSINLWKLYNVNLWYFFQWGILEWNRGVPSNHEHKTQPQEWRQDSSGGPPQWETGENRWDGVTDMKLQVLNLNIDK